VAVELSVADDGGDFRDGAHGGPYRVEMEALTAVTVAALTVVDMVKAVDPGAVISDIRWRRRPAVRPALAAFGRGPSGR
jgi:cyclic pyranopterin phosphate synthase